MDLDRPSRANRVTDLPDEHLDTQKKTFGKWLNSQLARAPPPGGQRRITDLFYDLRDGIVLLTVLEVLTQKPIKRERGHLRVHQLSNVTIVLNVLREQRVKLVNINNVDVVDGNAKITLALVWSIIMHWQFNKVVAPELRHVSNMEKSLLAWCRQSTASYENDVDIVNFTTSWKNGLAFLAIFHNYHPTVFDFESEMAQRSTARKRLEFAFDLFDRKLKLPRLLDPEDLLDRKPDKKSVMTYVMCIFQVLPHEDIDMSVLHNLSIQSDPSFSADNLIGSPFKSGGQNFANGKHKFES